MSLWPQQLLELSRHEDALVIVTVAGTRGSTPRETGAKMMVSQSASYGTIGGGQLEHECIAIAAEWLKTRTTAQTYSRRFTLGANCGQCCGGVVDILFEQIQTQNAEWLEQIGQVIEDRLPAVLVTAGDSHTGLEKRIVCDADNNGNDALAGIALSLRDRNALPCRRTVALSGNVQTPVLFEALQPAAFDVVIFGAGHVGSAMVASLASINCRISWIDSRDNIFPSVVPDNTTAVQVAQPQTLVAGLPAGQFCLVMTHSHALDLEICAQILQRGDMPYCGLIGSIAKRRQFAKRLKAIGLTDEQRAALVCPIGIKGISGKRPAEIAIAVTAQLLQLNEKQEQQIALTTTSLRQVSQ